MANGPIGFGTAEAGYGPSGVDVPEPIGTPEDQFVEDIHAIKVKYVDGITNNRVPLQLAANAGNRQDMTGQGVNCVLLTVTTGVIYGYMFDVSSSFGVAAGQAPDFAVSAGVVPGSGEFFFPTSKNYIVCFQEGAGAAAAGAARIMKV
jgi:hypothetical protein